MLQVLLHRRAEFIWKGSDADRYLNTILQNRHKDGETTPGTLSYLILGEKVNGLVESWEDWLLTCTRLNFLNITEQIFSYLSPCSELKLKFLDVETEPISWKT